MPVSKTRSRPELSERLRARRGEIESALLTRVYGVADPAAVDDPVYLQGLRGAVSAALDYGLAGIEGSEERPQPVPLALLGQARQAARSGVNLDTVLRRYFAGYALLGDFLIEEAEAMPLGKGEVKRLLRTQTALFDRLVTVVSEEYGREAQGSHHASAEQRRAKQIERLLAGEMVETADIAYDFEATHLGLVATGPEAAAAIRELASGLDCRSLVVDAGDGSTWGWFGGRHPARTGQLRSRLTDWPEAVVLALGEPAEGLGGWRLTHRQARAALPVAMHGDEPVVRYADVALVASLLQDELLTTSLRELYLKPLQADRDGGELARRTLCAYIKAGGNVSSAAAALGVSRQTIRNRLHAIEGMLGKSLQGCMGEVQLALTLTGGKRGRAS
jgi:hypothetical protein